MIGNNVVCISGGDLVEVPATQMVCLLGLIDRRFQEVLIEHAVVATEPFDGLVMEIVNDFPGKELRFLLDVH